MENASVFVLYLRNDYVCGFIVVFVFLEVVVLIFFSRAVIKKLKLDAFLYCPTKSYYNIL